jgi:hypothetical protein
MPSPDQSPSPCSIDVVCALPPSVWRPLSDIVSGIVSKIEVESAAGASRPSDLPKAA